MGTSCINHYERSLPVDKFDYQMVLQMWPVHKTWEQGLGWDLAQGFQVKNRKTQTPAAPFAPACSRV